MYATERHALIEQLVTSDGRVSVIDLAERFQVTTETVRRDLAVLEDAGLLRRVHGGAVSTDRISTIEPTVLERRTQHEAAKIAIARRALEAIPAGFTGSIFLDSGTTTAAVADALSERLARVDATADVITNSIALAPALADAPRVSLTVTGGRVRSATAAAVGATTVATIAQLRPDIAFVGTNAISADFGLSTPDMEEAAVKAAIVRAARRVILVVDGSKFQRESLRRFAGVEDIDVLVSEADPTGELAAVLAFADVEVWRA
ncbi:MAG: DeoR/GlpR transcriptional regulator [Microbacterium ginsengisoli]|uniref:DeoR/GlpR family DNA-binding transcription regulator n=1 Tax=Microbacterium TaxID=33882 RepID=UPI0009276715|nr:DeoR/GlpR family DNA-binding transcription regulator [Microbacterium sp. 71-23]MBN9197133.1 DeoR/GlpR transcriptional regulator [Microbacterium ginsengisoli]OJU77083.1 MAG: D-beta-D-heptose 1-phosphate adenosyltransferase [Microbacterium sp. 71-23]